MVPCQPPVVELRMHLMQCVLTAQQEKQEGARAWKDCLGTQGSSSEARAPEAWCGARSSRQRGVGPWAGRGPRTAQALSPPLPLSCWALVCCMGILIILYFCFFIFNTLLSLCASGKMVKKVCPCNQLCYTIALGLPRCTVVNNLLANAGEAKDAGSIPWVRKIPWRRKWQPTPLYLPGNFHGQRSLAGYSPWGHTHAGTLGNELHENELIGQSQVNHLREKKMY